MMSPTCCSRSPAARTAAHAAASTALQTAACAAAPTIAFHTNALTAVTMLHCSLSALRVPQLPATVVPHGGHNRPHG